MVNTKYLILLVFLVFSLEVEAKDCKGLLSLVDDVLASSPLAKDMTGAVTNGIEYLQEALRVCNSPEPYYKLAVVYWYFSGKVPKYALVPVEIGTIKTSDPLKILEVASRYHSNRIVALRLFILLHDKGKVPDDSSLEPRDDLSSYVYANYLIYKDKKVPLQIIERHSCLLDMVAMGLRLYRDRSDALLDAFEACKTKAMIDRSFYGMYMNGGARRFDSWPPSKGLEGLDEGALMTYYRVWVRHTLNKGRIRKVLKEVSLLKEKGWSIKGLCGLMKKRISKKSLKGLKVPRGLRRCLSF